MLKNIVILVFDIQDIGARFYTYITTPALCMQAAKENRIPIIVLDRPNPITGIYVEGNVTDKKFLGRFASYYPLAVRHGMTIGELALMYNKEFKINCKLKIIKMKGWKRNIWFDETGIPWVIHHQIYVHYKQQLCIQALHILKLEQMLLKEEEQKNLLNTWVHHGSMQKNGLKNLI